MGYIEDGLAVNYLKDQAVLHVDSIDPHVLTEDDVHQRVFAMEG
ncbi:MAG: hypothetical protein WC233_02875 [Sphaerochaeta sp.]|jgi:hypothetical protein